MNKIYSSLSLILLLLTLGSCDSMFDNEIPPHDLVGDNAITNESSAKVALNGVYSYLEGWGTWSAYYICDNEFRMIAADKISCFLCIFQIDGIFAHPYRKGADRFVRHKLLCDSTDQRAVQSAA